MTDWENVNWGTFDQTIRDIRELAGKAETAVNKLVGDESVPDEVCDALVSLKSAVVALAAVVTLHHRHVAELERSTG